jgi:hypothetical protein
MKTVKLQLDVPGELSLAIDREILELPSDGVKITKPQMVVKLIKEGIAKRDFKNDCRTLITGDVKDLPSLKFITLVTDPNQFPLIGDITYFESTKKGLIEVNGVLYMNHPSSITDFIKEYTDTVLASGIFGI